MTNLTYYDTPQALEAAAKALIIPTDVVLDVGCGIRPQWFFEAKTHHAIEPHMEYVNWLAEHHPKIQVFHGHWEMSLFIDMPGIVGTVFALDVIEHMERLHGIKFIQKAMNAARQQVIFFTPIGFYPQSYAAGEKDRWGMNGGYWQTHRSGWTPEDFGEGWQVLACKDYHKYDQYDQKLEQPIGAMYCIYTKEQDE